VTDGRAPVTREHRNIAATAIFRRSESVEHWVDSGDGVGAARLLFGEVAASIAQILADAERSALRAAEERRRAELAEAWESGRRAGRSVYWIQNPHVAKQPSEM